MVIALVSRQDLQWIVNLADGHGHTVRCYSDPEDAITAIRSGDIEAILVNVHQTEEGQRKRLKRIARENGGIPNNQILMRDPAETGAQADIQKWLDSLT